MQEDIYPALEGDASPFSETLQHAVSYADEFLASAKRVTGELGARQRFLFRALLCIHRIFPLLPLPACNARQHALVVADAYKRVLDNVRGAHESETCLLRHECDVLVRVGRNRCALLDGSNRDLRNPCARLIAEEGARRHERAQRRGAVQPRKRHRAPGGADYRSGAHLGGRARGSSHRQGGSRGGAEKGPGGKADARGSAPPGSRAEAAGGGGGGEASHAAEEGEGCIVRAVLDMCSRIASQARPHSRGSQRATGLGTGTVLAEARAGDRDPGQGPTAGGMQAPCQ